MNDEPIRDHENEMDNHFIMKIPDCCREGWPDCPHVVNREPVKNKRNIGL